VLADEIDLLLAEDPPGAQHRAEILALALGDRHALLYLGIRGKFVVDDDAPEQDLVFAEGHA